MSTRPFILILTIVSLTGVAACGDAPDDRVSPLRIMDSDPEQGRSLIQAFGCGACHTIDGVRGARGKVGPELRDYAQQHLLAGFLPNTPQHLIPWLMDPVALKPTTGMPAQGLTEAEARHVAAYLYTLGSADLRVYPPDPPIPLQEPGKAVTDLDAPMANASETTPRTRRIVPEPKS
jgi:mono/diheme cytochrome c family protein